jgi:hypothetical protein
MSDAEWDKKYPEHAKLRAVKDESQKLGAFLDWAINEQGWRFVDAKDEEPEESYGGIEGILASYFDVDRQALSNEKDRMVDEMRGEQEVGEL